MKTNSTQQQAKRETAKAWYDRLQRNSSSSYSNYAYILKKRGFTYCEIMDYFAGVGYK